MPAAPHSRVRTGAAGFALIETVIAIAVVVILVSGAIGAIVSGMNGSQLAADTAIAVDAARRQAERMAADPFRLVFALYNRTASDDDILYPGRGANFDVPGLTPRAGDTDGCGRVIMPWNPGNLTQLLETSTSASWLGPIMQDGHVRVDVRATLGMPRDLDGDGAIGTGDISKRYVLLPVTIVVEWRGPYGDASYALHVLLTDRSGT